MLNNKNWTGNKNSIYKCLGASNHCNEERQNEDFYATDPKSVQDILRLERFNKNIYEPAVGQGHIAKVLKENGLKVAYSDIINRGYEGTQIIDFLSKEFTIDDELNFDIITNPPYKYASDFLLKSLSIIKKGSKVALFLKLTFLEGQKRKQIFEDNPPKVIYVYSKRAICAKNGDFDSISSSAVAYAWFIWEKGFKGDPIIKWI